jgi:hypothetical protein
MVHLKKRLIDENDAARRIPEVLRIREGMAVLLSMSVHLAILTETHCLGQSEHDLMSDADWEMLCWSGF